MGFFIAEKIKLYNKQHQHKPSNLTRKKDYHNTYIDAVYMTFYYEGKSYISLTTAVFAYVRGSLCIKNTFDSDGANNVSSISPSYG